MGQQARSAQVPPVAASVGTARRLVTATLQDAGADQDTVDVAELLVSEVVTNAVLHTDTEIEVRVRAGGPGVLVEVSDRSLQLPRQRTHDSESVSGRGLDLVEMLAAQFGVAVGPDGAKSVWFTLGDAAAPSAPGWPAPATAAAVVVSLLPNLPVGLYRVLQQHNEALLREYELYLLDPTGAAGQEVGRRITAAARARAGLAATVLAAIEHLPDSAHHDVTVTTSEHDLDGLRLLVAAFAEAEELATRGLLLARPAVPELQVLRLWMFGQLADQLAGNPPTPWQLPDPEPVTGPVAAALEPAAPEPAAPARRADTDWVATCVQAVVAADDRNRILAASTAAAALFGWQPGELVGQRITVLIPPQLREAHLTGYTQHLLTGRTVLIGRAVTLPALRHDGSTTTVQLRLQTAPGPLYLAWFDTPDNPATADRHQPSS